MFLGCFPVYYRFSDVGRGWVLFRHTFVCCFIYRCCHLGVFAALLDTLSLFFLFFFPFFNSTARHVLYRSVSLTWSCFRHPHFELRKTQSTHRNGAAFRKPIVHSEQRGNEIISPHTLLNQCSGYVSLCQRYDCASSLIFCRSLPLDSGL